MSTLLFLGLWLGPAATFSFMMSFLGIDIFEDATVMAVIFWPLTVVIYLGVIGPFYHWPSELGDKYRRHKALKSNLPRAQIAP